MTPWPGTAPTLHRLRLHTRAPAGRVDSLALRQQWQRALDQADWAPPGLPPAAVLLVRHMSLAAAAPGATGSAPAPGGTGRYGGVQGGPGLARQLSQLLAQHAQQARRPGRDTDAAQADAVVFDDAADLAACLVRDWLQGQLPGRWWWRKVLAGQGAETWLQQHVLARGERLVPVAARLLAADDGQARPGGCLVNWLSQLNEHQAQAAQRAVAASHALADLQAGHDAASRAATSHPEGKGAPGPGVHHPRPPADPGLPSTDLQRLLQLAPELSGSPLSASQRNLLAQLLALQRAPGWARSSGLACALVQLAQAGAGPQVTVDPGAGGDHGAAGRPDPTAATPLAAANAVGPPPPTRTAGDRGSGPSPPQPSAQRQPAPDAATGTPPDDAAARPPRPDRGAPPELRSIQASAGRRPILSGPVRPHAAPPGPAPGEEAVPMQPGPALTDHGSTASQQRARARVGPDPAPEGLPVPTAYGGLLYLLNAALAMGLYGDFSAPRHRGLAMSPWDWLALVGQAWFGRALRQDPLWALLARLAGRRPGQRPAADFDAPPELHATPESLAPWGAVTTLHLQAGRTRLRLWHPAGFLLLDVPRQAGLRAPEQARLWLASASAPATVRHAALARRSSGHTGGAPSQPGPRQLPRLPRPGRARWLACQLLYLQARLALALGLEPEPPGGARQVPALATLLCCHPARISTSASDVDVHLALADLPLAVRFAGLDRDPGWIPAAGRSLRFHFS